MMRTSRSNMHGLVGAAKHFCEHFKVFSKGVDTTKNKLDL